LQAGESSQIIVATNSYPESFKTNIYLLQKKDRKWEITRDAIDGVIRKNGFANPDEKREGDIKSHSGIFRLQRTFSYVTVRSFLQRCLTVRHYMMIYGLVM
jgi:L,D-peptidoglycan transpeptidase YkuD (ErfK/YbiS/YcfS/YnhG family)